MQNISISIDIMWWYNCYQRGLSGERWTELIHKAAKGTIGRNGRFCMKNSSDSRISVDQYYCLKNLDCLFVVALSLFSSKGQTWLRRLSSLKFMPNIRKFAWLNSLVYCWSFHWWKRTTNYAAHIYFYCFQYCFQYGVTLLPLLGNWFIICWIQSAYVWSILWLELPSLHSLAV